MQQRTEEVGWLEQLFGTRRPLIGMVHLLPLPGSPGWRGDLESVLGLARADATALAEGGFHGVIVENHGDMPFSKGPVETHTVAAMALAVQAVSDAIALPVGVNVMRNDAISALALAVVTGVRFIRVNVLHGVMAAEEGVIEGQAYDALRYRKTHCAEVRILADVLVKHATPLDGTDIVRVAKATLHRGGADALIVSGPVTSEPTDLQDLAKVREALPEAPLFVGSGVTEDSVEGLLKVADGIIVGTNLKRDGIIENPVDLARVKRLAQRAGAA